MGDIMNYLNYINFEPYRLQLNELHGIPEGGRNGFVNGVERTDGNGKTMNYMLEKPTKTGNMVYVEKIDGLPQNIIDAAESELTEAEMVSAGFLEEV
jgi:hypothetical protein